MSDPWNAWWADSTAVVDLDGDGREEHVRIKDLDPGNEYSGRFALSVDQVTRIDSLNYRVSEYRIVDIDSTDHFREIAVTTDGPSDDYDTILYRWERGTLRFVHRIAESPDFPGDGRMLARFVCGFWIRQESYRFVPAECRFAWQPRSTWPVDAWLGEGATTARARVAIPLQRSATDTAVVATLQAGEGLRFLRWQRPLPLVEEARISGDTGWYEVRAETGSTGWFPGAIVEHVQGLLYPD